MHLGDGRHGATEPQGPSSPGHGDAAHGHELRRVRDGAPSPVDLQHGGGRSPQGGRPVGAQTRGDADTSWHQFERGKWIWYLPLGDIPDEVFLDPIAQCSRGI